MVVADMPFEPFLNLLRSSAKRLHFHLIVILVAREADCRWAFAQLDKDWSSLHDVTNNKIIFVTVDGEDHSPISGWNYGCSFNNDVGTLSGNYGLVAFSRRCKLLNNLNDPNINNAVVSEWTHMTDEEFVKQHIHAKPRQDGWGNNQSLGVSSILKALSNVYEVNVPCLYFEMINTSYSFIVPITNSPPSDYSFYKNFRKLLIDTDNILFDIRNYSDAVNKEENSNQLNRVYNSILWLKKWVNLHAELPDHIKSFIYLALDGKAQSKDVYKNISSIQSELDKKVFNTLRSHLNRITSLYQCIPFSQGKEFIYKNISKSTQCFEEKTQKIFTVHDFQSNTDFIWNSDKVEAKIEVLVIFANPRGTNQLRLQNEDRIIRECIERSTYRQNFKLEIRHAARPDDFARALLHKDYRIVQFSGHGTEEGLAFENETGDIQIIPKDSIVETLSAYSPPIECAILNACYAEIYADDLSTNIPYTIVMSGSISDESATEFTRGFYDAIGAGKTIQFAYQEGCRRIKLKGFPDSSNPLFFNKIA